MPDSNGCDLLFIVPITTQKARSSVITYTELLIHNHVAVVSVQARSQGGFFGFGRIPPLC